MERIAKLLGELESVCRSTLEQCTVSVETRFGGEEKTSRLLLPCGDLKYPSFWVRDCVMSCLSGLVDDDAVREYLEGFASYGQNGPETRRLKNGLEVPPWAVCDHLNYNGRPVWYPGTYADGEDQGDGSFGVLPPLDDNYWFVLLAAWYVNRSGDREILRKTFSGVTLIERLGRAWEGYSVDPETELCFSEDARYAVDWGFTDTVQKSGKLLFSSVQRFHAGHALGMLLDDCGQRRRAREVLSRTERLRRSIVEAFSVPGQGWLRSSTGICGQNDVWGTLFALWCGVPDEDLSRRIVRDAAEAYRNGTDAVLHGYVRHVRKRDDARPGISAWERVAGEEAYDVYQNGAYWATPSGWLFWALWKAEPELALEAAEAFCRHTEERLETGAPYEWINGAGEHSGSLYGTSAALPYLGMLRIAAEAKEAAGLGDL